MRDEKKMEVHLIAELNELRQRIKELEETETTSGKSDAVSNGSEEKIPAILSAITDTIALVDLDGTILSLNEVGAERFDKHTNELLGKCFYDFFSPDLVKSRKAKLKEVVRSKKPICFDDEREGRVFNNNLYPVLNNEGKVRAIAIYARDITEHWRPEEALHMSEEEFIELFKKSPIGIYRTTSDGRILIVNQALVHMLGYSSCEELAQRNLEEEGYHPEYPRSEFKRQIIRAGKILALESAWKRKDGRDVYVRESAWVIFDENGRPLFYEGMVEDITEHRRTEEVLKERRKELTCLYRLSRDIHEDLSRDELCRRIIEHLVSTMQFPEVAVPVIELNDKRFTTERYSNGLSHGLRADIRVKDDTCGCLWIYYTVDKPFLIPEEQNLLNSIAEALGMWLEHKQAEDELRETSDYLENLINYANAPIIVWDPQFRITRFNHAFERFTGYTSDEIIGQELTVLFPETSRNESLGMIERTLSGEYWDSVEIPILRKDGGVRLALWNSANIHGKDGKSLLATIAQGQDITERKRIEKDLRESEKKLAEQNILLQEKNIALREVLERLSEEKEQWKEQVSANVEQLLLPILAKLRGKGSQLDIMYIDLLENNLKRLTSSFGSEISTKMPRLTQRELEICNMIMNGLSSKEIARLLNISYRSVETHRNNIRKKLDIANKGINLVSYLKQLQIVNKSNA